MITTRSSTMESGLFMDHILEPTVSGGQAQREVFLRLRLLSSPMLAFIIERLRLSDIT